MNVSIILKLIDAATAPLRKVTQAVDAASKAIEKTKERADKAFERADRIKQASESMGRFAAQMRDGLGDVGKEASDFEQAMLGVAKQVDGARDAGGLLTPVYFDMAKQIQLLGREVPMVTNDIAKMVAAGARMGIPKKELIEFTRTAAMMAEAFELPAEKLAEDMGKISVLFKLTQPQVRELADAINYLDDNAISKGGDIIDFLQRAGGVAGTIKVSGREMAVLGSTMLTLGEYSFSAGRAINALFSKLGAANKGTKDFKNAMHEIGLSTNEIQKGMQVDTQGTFLKVLDAVNKLPKDQRIGVLVDMAGLEHSDTLAKLAANVGEYRKQIALAGSEKVTGSMSREFQARLATTAAQWEIMKNKVSELAVKLGEKLLPEVNKLLTKLGELTTKTIDWMQEHPTLTKLLLGTAVAVAAVTSAMAVLLTVISAMFGAYGIVMLAKSFGIFSLVLKASLLPSIWAAIPAIGTFAAGLWAAVAPALALAAPFIGIALIIAGITLGLLQLIRLIREWDTIDFGEVWKGFEAAVSDRSIFKTMTLNPFSGLGTGTSGGLQPVLSGSSAMPGSLGAGQAPMGTLVVKFDENNRPVVKSMEANGFNLEAEANSGRMMSY